MLNGAFLTGLPAGGLALVMTALLTPVALGLLRRGNVLDHPDSRSSHDRPTVRGAGIACTVSVLTIGVFMPALSRDWGPSFLVAGGLFALIGFLEDLVGIAVLRRLALQFVAAAVIVAFFPPPTALGGAAWLTWVLLPLGTVWLVAYVNAFNFMDGINGISVAQAVTAGIVFATLGAKAGQPAVAAAGVLVAGAALGFAPYNVPLARAFLGDGGSYFFGAWIAVAVVAAVGSGWPVEAAIAPVLLYLADTGTTLMLRVARGEVWYEPHRAHVYQRLVQQGLAHWQVSALVAALIAAASFIGAQSVGASPTARAVNIAALALLVAAYLLTPRWLQRSRARRKA